MAAITNFVSRAKDHDGQSRDYWSVILRSREARNDLERLAQIRAL